MAHTSVFRRSLVGRFALGSLAVFVLTGAAVSAVMIRDVRGEAEAQAVFHAHFATEDVLAPILTRPDLTAPIAGLRYAELRSLVERRLLSDGRDVRVKIWSPDGVILFSDVQALVGRSFPSERSDLQAVMSGHTEASVTDLSAPENIYDRSLASKLFSTYVPLRLRSGGPVVAVVEIYQDYTGIQAEVSTLFRQLAVAFAAGLLILYLGLLPVVRRAAKDTARQNDQLREAEAKYRSLVEQIPAIVYIAELGPEGDWLYVSGQIESMLGYTPKEWLAHPHPFATYVHPADRDRVVRAELRIGRTGEPYRDEYRMTTRDGRTIWVADQATLVRDGSGKPLFFQGLMADVTIYKQAQEELAGALETEREGAARLRELDEMKNTFLQAVSHELRTPLAEVLGVAITLEQRLEITSEERAQFLRSLVRGARKLDGLMSDLLDVDRLARGIVEPKRREVDVGALVHRLVRIWESSGDRRVTIDAPSLTVSVDPAKVERIVENLLTNVVRHTPPGTSVRVRTEPKGDGVLISVEDSGPGVPEAIRESIFEPFQQGPDTEAWAPGLGLGLSLVAGFARMHGGRAWVEKRTGGGASFRVFVPGPSGDRADRAPATIKA